MEHAPGGEEQWLIHEISMVSVPVKRRAFPKEANLILREALDDTLSLALSLHKSPPSPSARQPSMSYSHACFYDPYPTVVKVAWQQLN